MAPAVALLTACAGYEPPRPGVHIAPGEPRAQKSCEYAPPTGMVIARWNCRDNTTADEDARKARELLDRLPPPQPREF